MLLLGLSLILFLVSFFQRDRYKELLEDVDQLTLQHVQEIYQVKQRLRILEEEILINEDHFLDEPGTIKDIHEIIKNQVLALAQQGKSIEQIASQSSLSTEDVYRILKEGSDAEKR
jgi:preprotein translocase subunit Sec63